MRAFVLAALVACLAALAAGVQHAQACSCAIPDARSAVAAGDGAFVGTLVSRRANGNEAVLVFDVERSLKGAIGRTVEVRTPSSGAACGIETPIGSRVGLVLERRAGAWHGHLCLQFSPADLLAALRPLPRPTGSGPVALLVAGRFGTARLLALDRRGRTLAYGHGGGVTAGLSACPGNRRVAEHLITDTGVTVAIRELRTLRFVRRQRLRLDPRLLVHEVRCVDGDGERLLAFLSGVEPGDPDRARLLRIEPGRISVVWRGSAFRAALTDRHAYVIRHDPRGPTLVAIDTVTGRPRALARVPRGTGELVPDRAGTRFAGTTGDPRGGEAARLLLVDARTSPGRVRSVPLGGEIVEDGVLWLPGGRIAYASYAEVRTYDDRLRVVARVRPWLASPTTLAGDTVVGIRGASLIEASISGGSVRVVRRLPGATGRLVVAVR
jgi:hypothetical protein